MKQFWLESSYKCSLLGPPKGLWKLFSKVGFSFKQANQGLSGRRGDVINKSGSFLNQEQCTRAGNSTRLEKMSIFQNEAILAWKLLQKLTWRILKKNCIKIQKNAFCAIKIILWGLSHVSDHLRHRSDVLSCEKRALQAFFGKIWRLSRFNI